MYTHRGQSLKPPKHRLFGGDGGAPREPSEEQLLSYLEQGRFFLASVAMDEPGRCQEAIELFEKVSNADAAFYQAEVSVTLVDLLLQLMFMYIIGVLF